MNKVAERRQRVEVASLEPPLRPRAERFDGDLEGMFVQAMADQGVEVPRGAVQDEVCGTVVVFASDPRRHR